MPRYTLPQLRRVLAVAVLVSLSGSARAVADELPAPAIPVAPASPLEAARAHFAAADRALGAGDGATALVELEAARALQPSPLLSYYFGVAYELSGRPCDAIAAYRQYVAELPTAPNRAA